MNGELDPVLRTTRLVLRPVGPADATLLWPDSSDGEISRYMAWVPHTDLAQTVEFLKTEADRRESGRGATWGIFKDEVFCGLVSLIGLVRTHRALTYDKAELAYWLNRDHRGKGILNEAARCVMEHGFNQLGLHKIFVGHFAVNTASESSIKRLGFRYVGEQIEEFQKDGVWHNQKNYELLHHEFGSVSRTV